MPFFLSYHLHLLKSLQVIILQKHFTLPVQEDGLPAINNDKLYVSQRTRVNILNKNNGDSQV